MNEKLKEIVKQAGVFYSYQDQVWELTNGDLERFAELIIEDCAQICDVVRESNGGDKQFGARLCADEIRAINRRVKL